MDVDVKGITHGSFFFFFQKEMFKTDIKYYLKHN